MSGISVKSHEMKITTMIKLKQLFSLNHNKNRDARNKGKNGKKGKKYPRKKDSRSSLDYMEQEICTPRELKNYQTPPSVKTVAPSRYVQYRYFNTGSPRTCDARVYERIEQKRVDDVDKRKHKRKHARKRNKKNMSDGKSLRRKSV